MGVCPHAGMALPLGPKVKRVSWWTCLRAQACSLPWAELGSGPSMTLSHRSSVQVQGSVNWSGLCPQGHLAVPWRGASVDPQARDASLSHREPALCVQHPELRLSHPRCSLSPSHSTAIYPAPTPLITAADSYYTPPSSRPYVKCSHMAICNNRLQLNEIIHELNRGCFFVLLLLSSCSCEPWVQALQIRCIKPLSQPVGQS